MSSQKTVNAGLSSSMAHNEARATYCQATPAPRLSDNDLICTRFCNIHKDSTATDLETTRTTVFPSLHPPPKLSDLSPQRCSRLFDDNRFMIAPLCLLLHSYLSPRGCASHIAKKMGTPTKPRRRSSLIQERPKSGVDTCLVAPA